MNSKQAKGFYAAPVVNRDTGEALFITPKTITHTFSNLGMDQVALAEHLPEIIREAVLTHGEPSRKAPRDMSTGVFTLFGAVRTDKGVQPVKLKVKEYYIGAQDIPQNIQEYLGIGIPPETYASLYDGRVLVLESIEKEEASSSATTDAAQSAAVNYPSASSLEEASSSAPSTVSTGDTADKYPSAPSKISVKDLLDLVKGDAAKYVPARNSLRAHTGAEVESDPLMQALFGEPPAEPEAKTDALMQAILDTIKPAKPDRPLDVLEQEVLRLYAADPETGGFASESRWEPGLVADDYVIRAIKSGRTGENRKPYLSEADYRHLNAVCRALGVRARFVDVIPGVNANARIAGSEILIARDHRHPVRFVLGHELTHRIQALAPAEYRTFRDHVARDSASREAVEARIALYAKNGVRLTCEGALDEITADYAGELFEGGEVLDRFIAQHRTDRTLLEKLRDAFRTLIDKLTGAERRRAQTAEGKLTAALEAAARQTGYGTQTAGSAEGGGQYSIQQTADGKKYVRADRQVIFGNDPDSWGEQVENYINGKIRRGENVQLIAEDGKVLTLTADSAGKIASPYTSKGTTLPEDIYYIKVNAGAHIDELVQASTAQRKTKADVDGRHGAFASGGWTYRTVYFQDFDGKYYLLHISVARGSDGNVVYNIGDIRRRSSSDITGSSAKGGAQSGETPSEKKITQGGGTVKLQYSLKEHPDCRIVKHVGQGSQ